ncbi:MAG: aldose 1-epimerase family protein [Clostridia bacterium]|nr:aldose 1-epimerase family protein [Clostridia bacterium]
MKKSQEFELRKKCGDPSAICGIKDYVFNDGPARHMRAFDLKNGKGIEMTVLADRGLDIPYLSYKGHNISLLNKVGVRSPYLYQEEEAYGFLRNFYGGLMTTCGITYAGGAGEDEGRKLGLHGPYDNIPASRVCARPEYDGDDMVLKISGEVREAEVFGPNMVVKRTLTLDTERNELHIKDIAENQGYSTTPLMLVYHINFGYPILDEGAKCYFSTTKVAPRTDFAAEGMHNYDIMEAPGIERDEQCYFHTGHGEGESFAMLHNENLGIAAIVRYDKEQFPLMCEWKCMRAGDYALGLEPCTCGVVNRSVVRADGTLPFLEPGQSRELNITIELTDDIARIESYKARSGKC